MALLFGLFSSWGVVTEEPTYVSLGNFTATGQTKSFEVRDYAPSVAAQTCAGGRQSFMYLAGYIGVMTTPENSRQEKIAMTAPVVDYQNQEGEKCMQFILPESVYGSDVSSAPAPSNDKVELLGRPEMLMAALTFSGRPTEKDFAARLNDLKTSLKQMEADEDFQWAVKDPEHTEEYQYNDPWTPGPMRRNEVAIQLEKKN